MRPHWAPTPRTAFAHHKAGRYAEAVAWYRRALAENPGAAWLGKFHAVACVRLGEAAAGRAAVDRLRRACPGITPAAALADMPVTSPDARRRRELVQRDWAVLGFGC